MLYIELVLNRNRVNIVQNGNGYIDACQARDYRADSVLPARHRPRNGLHKGMVQSQPLQRRKGGS